MRLVKYWPILIFLLYVVIVYKPFLFQGKLPIPADTIVGMYHPWRDSFLDRYPNGVPFKNSLITDAVRQQYPWRQIAVDQLKNWQIPTWNPYSFSGTPLLANLQSAPFYFLNFFYWLIDFPMAWSAQVMAQTILGGLFMALFLRNLKLRVEAVLLGCLAWAGSGFFVSWLATNVVVQTVIWLPLILLMINKIFESNKRWPPILLIFLLSAAFFAGHLQADFYLLTVTTSYFIWKGVTVPNKRASLTILVCFGLFIVITAVVWLPAMQFIFASGRNLDQAVWQKSDWFIPWQHLVQFLAPDYFGNPATLNYFGVWNYGEFVGYIGLIPIFFVFLSIFKKGQKSFFLTILLLATVMALPTVLAKIPYQLNLPFFSSAQPSRLLSVIDFCLAVLSAFGLDWFLSTKETKRGYLVRLVGIFVFIFALLWFTIPSLHYQVVMRNLILPTAVFSVLIGFLIAWFTFPKWRRLLIVFLLLVTVFDLSRFAVKFLSFSSPEFLYPATKITRFLSERSKTDVFRVASLDDRVMPTNFSTVYRIQSVAGYDPLYLSRYGEFIAAVERGKADIAPPFNFNRQILPRNYKNKLFGLLGVKYILTLYDINYPSFVKVEQEGETRVFENKEVLPRAYFVTAVIPARDKQQAMDNLYDPNFDPAIKAVVEDYSPTVEMFSTGNVVITTYSASEIKIKTSNSGSGFLVLLDVYYPTWKVNIDGQPAKIYLTDFVFRGVIVPKGEHVVRFFQ